MALSACFIVVVCIPSCSGAPLRGIHFNGSEADAIAASVHSNSTYDSHLVNSSVSPHFTNATDGSFVWWDLEWGMTPHMSIRERNLWSNTLSRAKTYMEFGGGGSTVWALRNFPNLQHIHTVDSHPGWLNKLRRMPAVRNAEAHGRLVLRHANIGPVKEWGYPKNRGALRHWPCYSDEIYKAKEAQRWDVIFVDGRFRVACMLKAVDAIQKAPGAQQVRIIVHDYNNRHQYWAAETFLDRVGSADTMVVFKLKQVINNAQLQAVINQYEYVPQLF